MGVGGRPYRDLAVGRARARMGERDPSAHCGRIPPPAWLIGRHAARDTDEPT